MERSLLNWSIANSSPSELSQLQQQAKEGTIRKDLLNPEIIKALMGESDAEKMVAIVKLLSIPQGAEGCLEEWEEREIKWEDLEMLVGDLDNANDLSSLSLWTPLISFLSLPPTSPHPSKDATQSCWILGTAIQNNPKSLSAFLAYEPLGTLGGLVTQGGEEKLREKAMYCLLNAFKSCDEENIVAWLEKGNGEEVLQRGLTDPSISLRRRTVWFILSLLIRHPTLLSSTSLPPLLHTLVSSLSPTTSIPCDSNGTTPIHDDPTYIETTLKVLGIAASDGKLGEEERGNVNEWVERQRDEKGEKWWDEWGLEKEEGERLENA